MQSFSMMAALLLAIPLIPASDYTLADGAVTLTVDDAVWKVESHQALLADNDMPIVAGKNCYELIYLPEVVPSPDKEVIETTPDSTYRVWVNHADFAEPVGSLKEAIGTHRSSLAAAGHRPQITALDANTYTFTFARTHAPQGRPKRERQSVAYIQPRLGGRPAIEVFVEVDKRSRDQPQLQAMKAAVAAVLAKLQQQGKPIFTPK